MAELLRIAWRWRTTGVCEYGQFVLRDRAALERRIKWLNKEWPEIQHWIETPSCNDPRTAPLVADSAPASAAQRRRGDAKKV